MKNVKNTSQAKTLHKRFSMKDFFSGYDQTRNFLQKRHYAIKENIIFQQTFMFKVSNRKTKKGVRYTQI